MPQDRVERLRRMLDAVIEGIPMPDRSGTDDAWGLALAAFAASWQLDHAETARLAQLAAAALQSPPHEDPEATVLVYATLGLAAAGVGITGGWRDTAPGFCRSGDPLEDAVPLLKALAPSSDAARFARYALAEAALACGRVGLADRIVSASESFAVALRGHRFETVMTVLASRIASFSGRIDEARTLINRLPGGDAPRIELLVAATRSLIEGNAEDPATVRAITSRVEQIDREHHDRIESGVALLCAYGLIAQGEVQRSAALLAGFGWDRAMIIDRALACELLVNAASQDGDQAAAEAWFERVQDFAGDPIADSTLARARSRIEFMAGDRLAAIESAEHAIRRAAEEGRVIEAAEGEILAARARIAAGRRGEATRRLEAAVAAARPTGHTAVRRAAGRELHGTGRRLRPPAGSGRAELSGRELEVLALVLRGLENAEIATLLHISTHTARMHVSRILAAYGAPTRLALATRVLAESGTPRGGSDAVDVLTRRQRMVVAEAVTGATTIEIAERLGIAPRTVEKHLTDAMRRWGVTTRVGLLMRFVGSPGAERIPPE